MDELGYNSNTYTHVIHLTRSSWRTLLYGVCICISSTVTCKAIVNQQTLSILKILSIDYDRSYPYVNKENSSTKPKK